MSREAFEKWASKQKNEYGLPYFVILSDNGRYIDGTTNIAWDGWQAALQSGEPVARVIDDGTPEGATERYPFCNRMAPLKTGDLLYTTPQPVVDAVQIVQDCVAMGFLVETVDSSPTHRDLVKRAKALLSAGKEQQ